MPRQSTATVSSTSAPTFAVSPVAESFFATVEIELIEDADWQTRNEARSAIFDFVAA